MQLFSLYTIKNQNKDIKNKNEGGNRLTKKVKSENI